MTLDEKIAVMQAFGRGEEIEQVERTYDNWYRSPLPAWNWDFFLYRIKPKPKKVVVIEKWLIEGKSQGEYQIKEGTANFCNFFDSEKIKLLDTYGVEL